MDHIEKALEDHRAIRKGLDDAITEIKSLQSKLAVAESERVLYKNRCGEVTLERDHYMRQTTELYAEINSIGALINDSIQKVRMGQYRNNGAPPREVDEVGEIPGFLLAGPNKAEKIQ